MSAGLARGERNVQRIVDVIRSLRALVPSQPLLAANNLSDVDDPAAAAANIGALQIALNLSDLSDVPEALRNLTRPLVIDPPGDTVTEDHVDCVIAITGSPRTITLPDADTLVDGFTVSFVNSTAGSVVLDPPNTIDGAASLTLYPGEGVTIISSTTGSGSWGTLRHNGVVRFDSILPLTAAQQANARTSISASLKGAHYGLTISNNGSDATNDIDIAAGEIASTESNPVLMALAATLTKRLDAAWAVGSGNGGLDTGSIANATYHVWIIRRSDTGIVDALFSTSASAPTMPANYDQKAYLAPILRTGGAIKPFIQINRDKFSWVTPVQDVNGANPSTSGASLALTVPTGINVLATIHAILVETGAHGMIFSDLAQANLAVSANTNVSILTGTGAPSLGSSVLEVRTNTSGEIRQRGSSAASTYYLGVSGFQLLRTY